jgi:hypothetical protein
MKKVLCFTLAVLAFAAACPAARHPIADLISLYEYERTVPVEFDETSTAEVDGVLIRDITYESPGGGRVPAFLVEPAPAAEPGGGPGVLFGHRSYTNRAESLPEAIAYARAGAVCLLVDFPWARPEPWYESVGNILDPEADRKVVIQTVVDLRRGLDFLQYHPGCNGDLAYVGHSVGGQCGAILSAVDSHRLKAVVITGGAPSQRDVMLYSDDPGIAAIRAILGMDRIRAYCDALEDFDGEKYVRWTQAGIILFQFGRYERYASADMMQRYTEVAAGEPGVIVYDAGHTLCDPRAYRDRAAWLVGRVGLDSSVFEALGVDDGAGEE